MLNRKGHVGTTLMVLGALILVVTALSGFATFSDETASEKNGLTELVSEFQFKQKYVSIVFVDMIEEAIEEAKETENFEEEFGKSLKQIAERRRNPEISNLFGKIVEEPWDLNKEGDNYVLVVENVFAKFEKDKSVIERKFNFNVRFDENGIISQSL